MMPGNAAHPAPEQLQAFARGDSGDSEVLAIQSHLDRCPDCRQRLESAYSADSLLPSLRKAARGQDETEADRVGAVRALLGRTLGEDEAGAPEAPPPRVGSYFILSEVGRGGMGVVYKAQHLGLNRLAAVKMVLAGQFATREQVARFRLESELAARVRHPNVVQVYEVGEHAGRPFLALEWLEGGSLASWLNGRALPPREAAAVVETLARAMHAAHSQGVIHRDLKPANVMLTAPPDGQPHGILKITDFGLARSLDAGAGLTATGAILGTPEYLSPEAANSAPDCGIAADIYALGVILYECLTGRVPFRGATIHETITKVATEEPTPPRYWNPDVPRDLQIVCLRCLEKEPARRFGSALELAEELALYQRGEPVASRPVSPLERCWRWCRRKPLVASLTFMLILTLLAGIAVSWWLTLAAQDTARIARENEHAADLARLDANSQKDRALEEKTKAQQSLVTATLLRVGTIHETEPIRALWDLESPLLIPIAMRDASWAYYQRYCRRKVRFLAGHAGAIRALAWRRDGNVLAMAGDDRKIKLMDVKDHKEHATLDGHAAPVLSLAWSRDGKTLASASQDQTVKLWDPTTFQELATLTGHMGPVHAVAWSADGKMLATAGGDQTVKLWDPQSRRELATLQGHSGAVLCLAWSKDGTRLASAGEDLVIKIWDPVAHKEQATLWGHAAAVRALAWGEDGMILASAGKDGAIKFWDPTTGQVRVYLAAHNQSINALAWSADGNTLASAGEDQAIKLWDPRAGTLRSSLVGNLGYTFALAWSPNDMTLASAGQDQVTTLWNVDTSPAYATLAEAERVSSRCLAWSTDSKTLAAANEDGLIRLWDVAAGKVRSTLDNHRDVVWVGWSQDGENLATVGANGNIKLWNPATAEHRITLLESQVSRTYSPAVAWSSDGETLAIGCQDRTIRLWDLKRGEARGQLEGHIAQVVSLAWNPDGRTLCAGSVAGRIKFWDASSGQDLQTVERLLGAVICLAWSPDGKTLAIGCQDATTRLWDAADSQQRAKLEGHNGVVHSLAWSPDGRTLATAGHDQTIRLWDSASGQNRATLGGHDGPVTWLAWSPDGKFLASASDDGTIKLWDLSLSQE